MQETTPSDNSRPYNLMSNLEWFTASEALLKWKSTRVVTRPKSTAWRTSWHTRSTADGVLYPPLNSDCLESKISLATINSVICRWRTRVKKTILGESLAGSHSYNLIRDSGQDSWRDFSRQKVSSKVWWEFRIGLYAWLPTRLFWRFTFFTRELSQKSWSVHISWLLDGYQMAKSENSPSKEVEQKHAYKMKGSGSIWGWHWKEMPARMLIQEGPYG